MITTIEVPIAIGELIDKITILEIKVERIEDPNRTVNAQAELTLLYQHRDASIPLVPELVALAAQLKIINEKIWDLEDAIRDCERKADFGPSFVATARSIYRTNDQRAALKREINLATGSLIIEEKSYADY